MTNKICVYAICKDEKQFVNLWLDSMQEADYIVVMDTGSTDGTYEMLQKDSRVTKVIQQKINPWRFDVARNESMRLCPDDANILVCTDFDERFEPGWAQVLRDHWEETTTRCFYTYAWGKNAQGESRDIFKYDKIHTRDYEWIYPVHEVLKPKKDNFLEVGLDVGEKIYLKHYQDTSKPRKYYFDLLKLACKENPKDSHIRMLLAREYLLNKDNKNAINEYLQVLQMPDVDAPNKRLVLLCSLFHLALLYEQEKNFDECLWYCQEFIKEDPTYREPYFLMAEVFNLMKMYTLAEATVKAGFEYGVRKYNWIEYGNTWLGWGFDLLSVAQINLGKYLEAEANIKIALKHEPNDTRLLKNYTIILQNKISMLCNKSNQGSV